MHVNSLIVCKSVKVYKAYRFKFYRCVLFSLLFYYNRKKVRKQAKGGYFPRRHVTNPIQVLKYSILLCTCHRAKIAARESQSCTSIPHVQAYTRNV
jgi:hypothetical protein